MARWDNVPPINLVPHLSASKVAHNHHQSLPIHN